MISSCDTNFSIEFGFESVGFISNIKKKKNDQTILFRENVIITVLSF